MTKNERFVTVVEVEHVKAHRTKKDKKEMSHFEKFVTEGNEKADELAKEGAMLDEGCTAEARAKTVQQDRCSIRPASTVWWRNGKTVKNSSQSQRKSGNSLTEKGEDTKHRTD